MPRAVVLLSGGVDSATAAAIARGRGFELLVLSFDYGQRHAAELHAARRVARFLRVAEHIVQTIDLRAFGGSALTADIAVPKNRHAIGRPDDIPSTYVPARNTIFLSFALAYAEARGAGDIFLGINALDYSGYPDCRPEYLRKFQELAALATRDGVQGRPLTVQAPLIEMTKAQIMAQAHRLGLPLELTLSCYDPDADGGACGGCDSCRLRRQGFAEAGLPDCTRYHAAAAPGAAGPAR